MKPVPRTNKEDEDSITELKKQNEKDGDDTAEDTEEVKVAPAAPKENGYLTVLKNAPFLCVMLANLPAVMGLYIPYMFLPGVSALTAQIKNKGGDKESLSLCQK